jgi:hypothetical protein
MQRKLIICLGPVCSGKTTWSNSYVRQNENVYRFCFDEYLYMCTNKGIYDKKLLHSVPSLIGTLLMRADVVIDGFPLEYDVLRQTMNYKYGNNAAVQMRLMDVKFDEAVKRNINRAKITGRSVNTKEMRDYMVQYKEFISSDDFRRLTDTCEVICDNFIDANMSFIS